MVTLSPAEYFRLHDRGIIAPGKIADFTILDAEEMTADFRIHSVWKNGRQIVRDDDIFAVNDAEHLAPAIRVKVTRIPTAEQIRVPSDGEMINVIGVTEGTVITQTLNITPKTEGGYVVPDSDNDIAKIVVLERHRDTGRFAVGFVKGLGIRRGAVGSSVAHE